MPATDQNSTVNKNDNIHKKKFNKSDDQTNIDNIRVLRSNRPNLKNFKNACEIML